MIEHNKMNVKLSDRQLKELKPAVKNKTGVTLRMSLKLLDGNDLPHELLLLTTRQKKKLRNTFNNNMSTDLTLSKVQISKLIQSGGFLGSLLSKLAGPLMKVAIPLAKNVLAPIGITTSTSAFDAEIHKKIHDSSRPWSTTLTISNKEMNDVIKIVQALEDSKILLKRVTKVIKNETKEQKGGFLSMLLCTLGASLLGNNLAEKRIVRAGSGCHSSNSSTSYGNKKEKGIVRAGYGKEWDF